MSERVFAEPILILSDLHVRHPLSLIHRLEALAPLMEGAGTVIFNGDSTEQRFRTQRVDGWDDQERLAGFVRGMGADPVFVTGNHDPFASQAHHVELAGGLILVTHGDGLFESVTPWSPAARLILKRRREVMRAMTEQERADLDRYLWAAKQGSLVMEDWDWHRRDGIGSQIKHFVDEFWPPWRPLRILATWVRTPGVADAFAEQFRPRAEYVIIGHTHHPGVWRRGGRWILNTGSFTQLLGQMVVWIEDGSMAAHRVCRERGSFRRGRRIRTFRLPAGPVPRSSLSESTG